MTKDQTIYKRGNEHLLKKFKCGILASRIILPHLTQRVIDSILQISDQNVALISGWHSPMEVEIHSQLIKEQKPHIHAGAKSIRKLFCKSDSDRMLFITHCGPNVQRVTRENALERNRKVAEISDMILIAWLDPNGKTHSIIRSFCKQKPVYVFDQEYNSELRGNGAKVFDVYNIATITERSNANH